MLLLLLLELSYGATVLLYLANKVSSSSSKDKGDGCCKTCKAPVKMSPSTNQHPSFLQARCPSCHPINSVGALKGIQINYR